MELWILLTFFAAFFQNLRSALQKHLAIDMGATASAYTRFVYALPFAVIYAAVMFSTQDVALPALNWSFAIYVLTGGTAQILATTLLVKSFQQENFAQGTAFSKTEVLQTALAGFIILDESLTLALIIGILTSLAGVLGLIGYKNIYRTLSANSGGSFINASTWLGLAAGAAFAIAAVAYRGASLALPEYLPTMLRAAATLASVLLFQTLIMGSYLFFSDLPRLSSVFSQWKSGLAVGVSGMLASVGWFSALAMQGAAHVRALGQFELVFAVLTSILIFKERIRPSEILGIILLSAGILVIILE